MGLRGSLHMNLIRAALGKTARDLAASIFMGFLYRGQFLPLEFLC